MSRDSSTTTSLYRPRSKLAVATAAALAFLMAVPVMPAAFPSSRAARHEVPPTATALLFLRPEGDRLRVLARVPLEAMRDVIWPLRDQQYLIISRSDSLVRDAVQTWVANYIHLYENDRLLSGEVIAATRVTVPSDRAFSTYENALAGVHSAALPDDIDLPWRQALIDVLFEYPITTAGSDFSITPELAHLGVRTTTVLRFAPPGGAERVLQFTGNPGLVRLDPSWHQSAMLFVKLGFQHILGGIDHLLFLLCLVIPFRRLRPLVIIVTSFTVAHSITLIASALNFAPTELWFTPLIETLIALSIVFMAFENIVGPRLDRRWVLVFVFGLVHGFGFSFFLRESLQFAGSHLGLSLLAFNVGVELGQLLVILIMVPLLGVLFRAGLPERIGTIIISALVAHTAWHWMTERGAEFLAYDFQAVAFDAAMLASLMRWLMFALILAGIVALLIGFFGKLMAEEQGAADGR